jgi:hypothetical protein
VLLALVRALLLLVHHDEAEVAQGRQDRVAHPHEEGRIVVEEPHHVPHPLRGVEAGVAHGHLPGEAPLQAGQEPGGEADLGHQPEDPPARGQHPLRQLQVDLGLAGARHPEEEVDPEGPQGDPGHGRLLLGVEDHPPVRGLPAPGAQEVQALGALHQTAPLQGRQDGGRHLGPLQELLLEEGAPGGLQDLQGPGLGGGGPPRGRGLRAPHGPVPGPPQVSPVEEGGQRHPAPVPGLPQFGQAGPGPGVPQVGQGPAPRDLRLPARLHGGRQGQGQEVGQAAPVVAAREVQELLEFRGQEGKGVQDPDDGLQGHPGGRGGIPAQDHAHGQAAAQAHLHPEPGGEPLRREVGEGRQGPRQLDGGGYEHVHEPG